MRISKELLHVKNGNHRVDLVLHTCQRHHGYVSITAEAKNTPEHLRQTFSLTSIYFYVFKNDFSKILHRMYHFSCLKSYFL